MRRLMLSRRRLVAAGTVGLGAAALGGCDRLDADPRVKAALMEADGFHEAAQRLLGRHALAREYASGERSPDFRSNGNVEADDPAWLKGAANGFADWQLVVDGLVERPLALGLATLKAMPQRRQITRHDCVEGWSAIGEWQGPRLSAVLDLARVRDAARYAVFHCADRFGDRPYYESIDMVDARHPQTILAWAMNGQPLPVAHGAPLRLRVERQLGYKQAKFVQRIELRASLSGLFDGQGGYWEDTAGYHWFAGI